MSDFVKLQTGKAKIFHVHIVGQGIVNKFSNTNQYVCGVSISKNSEFVKEVNKIWNENKPSKNAKLKLFKVEYEKDSNGEETDIETGNVSFFAKSNLETREGKKKIIKVYDSKNTLIKTPENIPIGNGTIADVSVALNVYTQNGGGISCYLNAVKILKLKEFENDFGDYEPEEGEELYEISNDFELDDNN